MVPFLKKGKIFCQEEFSQATRKAQRYRENEREKGNLVSKSKARRPKYQIEIQTLAAMILAKNEDPTDEDGLSDMHKDTLELSKLGMTNYRSFFDRKIDAHSTGSIRLKPAFILKSESAKYEKIENMTKKEILKEISEMISSIEFEEMNEREYFEAKCKKSSIKKEELIEMHTELQGRIALQTL